MTTWTLILIFCAGGNAAIPITINDIKSHQECVRISDTIKNGAIGNEYRYTRKIEQCVEVMK